MEEFRCSIPVRVLLLIYNAMILICELLNLFNGQNFSDTLLDCLLFCLAITTVIAFNLSSNYLALIFVYEVVECFSFGTTGQRVGPEFGSRIASDFFLGFLMAFLMLAILLAVYLPSRCSNKRDGIIPVAFSTVFLYVILILAYFWYDKVYHGITVNQTLTQFTSENDRQEEIRRYFSTPRTASFKDSNAPRKNLIFIMIESWEKQCVGFWNKRGYPKAMPYLMSLAEKGTRCTNVEALPFTKWTASAFVASMCGIPLISSSTRRETTIAELMSNMSTFRCIGDHLASLNYTTMAYVPGETHVGHMDEFMRLHGWHHFHDISNGFHRDGQMTKELTETTLEKLSVAYHREGKPFALALLFQDTRPRFHIGECRPREENSGWSRAFNSYDCTDQRIRSVLSTAEKKYNITRQNTEIVIVGNHMLLGSWGDFFVDGRTLLYLFASQENREISKPVTIYDIPHTIMDSLGINYGPEFPFGANIYTEKPAKPPQEIELRLMFDMFNVPVPQNVIQ